MFLWVAWCRVCLDYQTGSNGRMGRYGFEVTAWLVNPNLSALVALELVHQIARPRITAAIAKLVFLHMGTSLALIGARLYRAAPVPAVMPITLLCWTVIQRVVR